VGKKDFIQTIRHFYSKNKRDLPWRNTKDPYDILISEIMLQQTQVHRILKKYDEFIAAFPGFASLSKAPQAEILRVWQGLGYNRRALYLKKIAEIIFYEFDGIIPDDPSVLEKLPGIGPATARSIVVFSFNKPYVFIETNIRRVFIHHFFENKSSVSDKELVPIIEETLDRESPREWYYALMDYGSYLGKIVSNPNRRSSHYSKQSKFEGSVRQVRGAIIKFLLEEKSATQAKLKNMFASPNFDAALSQLQNEGFIETKKNKIILKS
jgi:A/G-specific adenine glycosylase